MKYFGMQNSILIFKGIYFGFVNVKTINSNLIYVIAKERYKCVIIKMYNRCKLFTKIGVTISCIFIEYFNSDCLEGKKFIS